MMSIGRALGHIGGKGRHIAVARGRGRVGQRIFIEPAISTRSPYSVSSCEVANQIPRAAQLTIAHARVEY